MNLLAHQTHLIHVANGTLMAQKRLIGIELHYAQWLHCMSYIFSAENGRGVAAILNKNQGFAEIVDAAWEEYRNA